MAETMGICAIIPRGQEGFQPQVFGMGILVSDTEIITCAHVLDEALGLDGRAPSGGATVSVCFPFADEEESVEALVDPQRFLPAGKARGPADIAVIRLGKPAPASVQRAFLAEHRSTGRGGGLLKTYGFRSQRRENGGWESHPEGELCEGRVVGSLPRGRGQFDGLPITGAAVQHGFSGAGLYDPAQDGVVGMIVEADVDSAKRIAQFIDTRTLRKAFGTPLPAIPPLLASYVSCLAGDGETAAVLIGRSVMRQPGPHGQTAPPAAGAATAEPLIEAVQRESKLFLLGDPGTGKSTALQFLEKRAAAAIVAAASMPADAAIPVRIELKTYRGERELESLLAKQIGDTLVKVGSSIADDPDTATGTVKAWLREGKFPFLILLDAVDEVPARHANDVRLAIAALLKYRHRILVSCRIADYDESLHGLAASLVLLPLQQADIADYLRRTLLDEHGPKLLAQLARNQQLLRMAANPLLLSLLADVYRDAPDAGLPRNEGQLIAKFVERLPSHRRRERLPEVSRDIVTGALKKLAMEMLDRDEKTPTLGEVRAWALPCDRHSLETVLAEAKSLRFLRSDGSLEEPVEFIHPLFGEYFAAAQLDSLMQGADADCDSLLRDRQIQSRWVLPITMLAGIQENAAALIIWLARDLRVSATLPMWPIALGLSSMPMRSVALPPGVPPGAIVGGAAPLSGTAGTMGAALGHRPLQPSASANVALPTATGTALHAAQGMLTAPLAMVGGVPVPLISIAGAAAGLFWSLVMTRVEVFMLRWETSSAHDDAAVRSEVLPALRNVVRYSRGAIARNDTFRMRECNAALWALRKIGDPRSLPDLDEFASSPEAQRATPALSRFIGSSPFNVFQLAAEVAADIRKRNNLPPTAPEA